MTAHPGAYHRILINPFPPARSNRMLVLVQRVTKAIAGGLSAGATTFAAVLPDGVTSDEWAKVFGFALAAGVVVWLAPKNKPAAG